MSFTNAVASPINCASNIDVESLKDWPGQDGNELGPEHNDDTEDNDSSDTSRVVDTAITYARECLRSENYIQATLALRSVLEISKPTTTPYKMVVLQIAQVLYVTQELKASTDCMLGVYRVMPPPLSTIDGICVIARSYEQLQSNSMARFWWKKLNPALGVPIRPDICLWEAMADRLFDAELYVFAADFYAQAMAADVEQQFVPSNRFRYRYLFALLAFVEPQGPTVHMDLCRSVAWSLVQWFRRRNRNAIHVRTCFGDPHFYRMLGVYFTSFPAVYRAVFVWLDGPAGRIARCWRRYWAKLHPPPKPVSLPPSSNATLKGKKKPNASIRQSRSPTRTEIRGKVSAPLSTSLSPTKKPRISDRNHKQAKTAKPGRKTERNNSIKPRNEVIATPGLNNNALSVQDNQQFQSDQNYSTIKNRCDNLKINTSAKKSSEFDEHSSMKRRFSAVKRLRAKRSSADPTSEKPSSAGVEKHSSDEEQIIARSSSTSLLDVYPLDLSRTEDFIASCGREPGFADLDLNQVGEFARLAHYRSRVLTGKHASVNNLDTTKVEPQWLQEVEKAVAFIKTHQQHNLASCKVVVEGDSIAHLSEVHTRLVLMITTLCRQYTRDFGETSFTRRLRGIIRKLIEWKFTRISEAITALNDAKAVAIQEEKQRNLEFYHVHRA
ncbi:hypothetical protein F443_14500 [Phytophthora nicotianae P1569]|uniref:Uncharacterized protein n=1 Tax=Phytophthora nicotianae P1569 TaxID=1317065 RepID=V9ENB5_PHYNI|nr:hypothetical protein F443_14500 [Phytophthora nicotianae P1569]